MPWDPAQSHLRHFVGWRQHRGLHHGMHPDYGSEDIWRLRQVCPRLVGAQLSLEALSGEEAVGMLDADLPEGRLHLKCILHGGRQSGPSRQGRPRTTPKK